MKPNGPESTEIPHYCVFLASPKDAQEQRDAVRAYFENLNAVQGSYLGVHFDVIDCENYGNIGAGEPQKQLRAIWDRYSGRFALFVGIFRQWFGTSTSTHPSGTVEEYEWALEQFKEAGYPEIQWYFYQPEGKVSFTDDEDFDEAVKQWKKVKAFRAPLETGTAECEVAHFQSASHFKEVLAHHIDRWVLDPDRPWINGEEASPVPEAMRAHLDRLIASTSRISLLGLGSNLQVDLPIEKAFVPLRTNVVTRMEGGKRGAGKFFDEELGEAVRQKDLPVDQLFVEAAKFGGRRGVVLLGDPGSGKTTAARQLAWRLASEPSHGGSLGLDGPSIPILLRFRRLDPQRREEGLGGLLDIECRSGLGKGLTWEDFQVQERRLWILDGLDEIVEPELRAQACRWVENLLSELPKDRFLVTSRFQGYQGKARFGAGFLECHVRPLNPEQIERFVRLWYQEIETALNGDDPQRLAEAAERAGALVELFKEQAYTIGSLRELPTNPLLLTILCIVHHGGQRLPDRRADLYRRCLQVLLGDWKQGALKKLGAEPFQVDGAIAALAAVAWDLHQEDERASAPVESMAEAAQPVLEKLSVSAGLPSEGQHFLERMRDECGVLAVVVGEEWGFLHLSFQEYLCAYHAVRNECAPQLAARFGESWWREVTLLALAVCDKEGFYTDFFNSLLESDGWLNESNLFERSLRESSLFLAAPFERALLGDSWDAERKARLMRTLVSVGEPQMVALAEKVEASGASEELKELSQETRSRAVVRSLDEASGAPTVEEDKTRKAGTTYTDEHTGLVFSWIPSGSFQMGSKLGGPERERPVREVRLSCGFWLGRYVVTNRDYARFLESEPDREKPNYWDNREFNGESQPVVGISWKEVQKYCEWARCRLPTEAEWEYACRAGTTTPFNFRGGEKKLNDYGWFSKNSEGSTHPVGLKPANAWGLHDMHGNVWEWCQDWYDGRYYGSRPDPDEDPQGPDTGEYRVLRGGSWGIVAGRCRSACRFRLHPGSRDDVIGFRVVLAPPL